MNKSDHLDIAAATTERADNIIGRDGHVIAQALAHFVALVDALPQEHRPVSDQEDIKAILERLAPGDLYLSILQGEASRRVETLKNAAARERRAR